MLVLLVMSVQSVIDGAVKVQDSLKSSFVWLEQATAGVAVVVVTTVSVLPEAVTDVFYTQFVVAVTLRPIRMPGIALVAVLFQIITPTSSPVSPTFG